MKSRITALALGITALLCVGAFAAGCGSSSDESSSTAAEETTVTETETGTEADDSGESATTAVPTGGQGLEIKMGEYFYTPSDGATKSGSVTIDAPNVGEIPHELVLAKTNLDPAKLPTLSDGSVDEESLDSPGEVEEVAPGATGTTTLDLTAGKYVIFCNLPAHYAAGMYGTLTVK